MGTCSSQAQVHDSLIFRSNANLFMTPTIVEYTYIGSLVQFDSRIEIMNFSRQLPPASVT